MLIHRSRPEKGFALIPNSTLRDERLSFVARGVLCELLSHPDDWVATADSIAAAAQSRRARAGEGRRAMRAVFAELVAAGYLVKEKKRGPDGRIVTEMHLYDQAGTGVPDGGTSVSPRLSGVSAVGTDVPGTGVPDGGTSNRRQSTNTKEEDGRNDLASRRGRAKRTAERRTVQSVIANVTRAAVIVYGQADAQELTDGHALALYYSYAHRKDVHDLVAYMMKIFGDAPNLDTFIANAGWCCPSCQRWEDECACAA